ncbi:hypothetical protein HPB47_021307, partial [Ixodes persulcatus]
EVSETYAVAFSPLTSAGQTCSRAMDTPDLLSAALDESGIGEEEVANHNNMQDNPMNPSRFPPGSSKFLGGGDKGPGGGAMPYFMMPPFGYKANNGSAPFPMFRPPFDMKYAMGPGGMPLPPQQTGEDAEEEEELGLAETYAEYTPSKLARLTLVVTSLPVPKQPQQTGEDAEEEEELGLAETYAEYTPSKPALLAADMWQVQLPAAASCSEVPALDVSNEKDDGFGPGDGAGVGKGRTIAGIIYENYLLGRKRAIWVSVSNDLKYDSERDLRDIGAGKLEVHSLNKFKYAKISSKVNGSVKKGVIFSTYSSLIGESQSGGKYKTRLKQLLHWCGDDFDGVIVFDECHKAKNLCPVGSSKPTKTGLTVLELQNKLPKARVVYASATGASEPKNMAYMTRLGIWG